MPLTNAQIDANRTNAQHSTGPRSPEGKAASSRNASKHNLTGGEAFLPGEDPAAYQAHLEAVREEYGPASPSGEFVVRQSADSMWRLQRLQRMEDELMASSPNPFMEEDATLLIRLERLQRYRAMIERTYHRFAQEWRKIVAEDVARVDAESEAALLQKQVEYDRRYRAFVEDYNRRAMHSMERATPSAHPQG